MTTTTLSRGEKIALAAGKEITTIAQFAVCFCVAEKLERRLRNLGMSDNFGLEAGMKPETYRRAVNKFGLLINDRDHDEDETDKEAIYPKIREAFLHFREIGNEKTLELAKSTFTVENREIGQEYQFQVEAKKNKYSAESKARKSKEENNLISEYNSLMRFYVQNKSMPSTAANKKVIGIMAQKHNKTEVELKKLFKFNA